MSGSKPKPKPRGPSRKTLEAELEALIREIVDWRDAGCIEADLDGGRCSDVMQWGHLVPRKQSSWLKLTLDNTFKQCRTHNFLHDRGDQTMILWYVKRFGSVAYEELLAVAGKGKPDVAELRRRIAECRRLLDNRPPIYDDDYLMLHGYFGETAQDYARFGSEAK